MAAGGSGGVVVVVMQGQPYGGRVPAVHPQHQPGWRLL